MLPVSVHGRGIRVNKQSLNGIPAQGGVSSGYIIYSKGAAILRMLEGVWDARQPGLFQVTSARPKTYSIPYKKSLQRICPLVLKLAVRP